MNICIENESSTELDFDYVKLLEEVIEKGLYVEGVDYQVEINVLLTDNSQIREINKEYRGIDRYTDVLSFPAIEYNDPLDFSKVELSPDIYFNMETEELILGDIVLSLECAVAQAKEYGHSTKREFAFLIVHSLLHLLGYDHIEEADRKVMEDRQRLILSELNISRSIQDE